MEKANIKKDEFLAEQLEHEDGKEEEEEVAPRQERNEDEGMAPDERGSERAENAPAPTDVDDEDITLGEFFYKRKRVSGEFGDFGEVLRRKGKKLREAASEASGAGPSAGAAPSRDPPKSATRDLEMGRGDQDMSNCDITPRVDRDKREPEDNGRVWDPRSKCRRYRASP